MTDEPIGVNFNAVFDQGSEIWARIPALSNEILKLKLEGIDQGGIWIQNQTLTDGILRAMNRASFEATPIIFVPYSAILYAVVLAEGASLSAEKLGL